MKKFIKTVKVGDLSSTIKVEITDRGTTIIECNGWSSSFHKEDKLDKLDSCISNVIANETKKLTEIHNRIELVSAYLMGAEFKEMKHF
jgi:Asp-tRNA(Asn)/Glu-tRNA(Gln) amidotransferase B subunit